MATEKEFRLLATIPPRFDSDPLADEAIVHWGEFGPAFRALEEVIGQLLFRIRFLEGELLKEKLPEYLQRGEALSTPENLFLAAEDVHQFMVGVIRKSTTGASQD